MEEKKLMMYKLAVTIYSGLWTCPPAAFVNEGLWTLHWNQMLGNTGAVGAFLYWRGESLQRKNKFTNKQHDDHSVSCRWLCAVNSFFFNVIMVLNPIKILSTMCWVHSMNAVNSLTTHIKTDFFARTHSRHAERTHTHTVKSAKQTEMENNDESGS